MKIRNQFIILSFKKKLAVQVSYNQFWKVKVENGSSFH